MVLLDDTWLTRSLAACTPSLPGLTGSPALTSDVSPEELTVLQAIYGSTGDRLDYARNVYELVKAQACLLACDAGFAKIWPSLICSEWLAHLRLEDHLRGKLYRDHIFHPAIVAMLGWELLDSFPAILRAAATSRLQSQFGGNYTFDPVDPKQRWDAVLEQAWLVAGFFHDHCYPIELLARQAKSLVLPAALPRTDVLIDYRKNAWSQCKLGHFDASVRKILRNRLGKAGHSHAALGALSLYALKASAANDFARAVLDIAADAVLWHHSVGEGYHWARASHFQFAENPVRYLLVLCDGLHEFCREVALRKDAAAPGTFTISFRAPCPEAELEITGTNVKIAYTISCADGKQACETRWKLAEFTQGLRRVTGFVNRCGPLQFNCVPQHGACDTCPVRA